MLSRQGIKTKTALGSQAKSPPSPCPLLVKNLLAHLAQSSEEPRRGLVGFACAARIDDAPSVRHFAQGRPTSHQVGQVLLSQLTSHPSPKLFNWVEVWAPWGYVEDRQLLLAVCSTTISVIEEALIVCKN